MVSSPRSSISSPTATCIVSLFRRRKAPGFCLRSSEQAESGRASTKSEERDLLRELARPRLWRLEKGVQRA